MKYRVEAEFRYKGYIEVEAPNEDAAWDIAEDTDGGEFIEMPETSGWEIEKPKLIGIETKEIDVADFGVQDIAKESDQDAAIESGYDDSIFFYVPDDVFARSDAEIKEFVDKNVFCKENNMEVTVDNLNDMCALMCDNVVPQKGKKMIKQFDVQISDEDYEICERYGFAFEKNFAEMVKDVAQQLRKAEEV